MIVQLWFFLAYFLMSLSHDLRGNASWTLKPRRSCWNRNFSIPGDPADPTWTIYLAQAQIDEMHLQANDEIAIFDGNKLVGAFQLTEPLI